MGGKTIEHCHVIHVIIVMWESFFCGIRQEGWKRVSRERYNM